MTFELKGRIHTIMETKQVSEKFKKREFVIEVDDGKYPQLVSFQIVNDKIEQLDTCRVNDTVTVQFNVRGREWTSPQGEKKFFNTLDAWKIVGETKAKAPSAGYVSAEATAPSGPSGPEDDIPF